MGVGEQEGEELDHVHVKGIGVQSIVLKEKLSGVLKFLR